MLEPQVLHLAHQPRLQLINRLPIILKPRCPNLQITPPGRSSFPARPQLLSLLATAIKIHQHRLSSPLFINHHVVRADIVVNQTERVQACYSSSDSTEPAVCCCVQRAWALGDEVDFAVAGRVEE